MDFFQQQAKVRGRSHWLLLLFLLAVLGIVGAIDAVVLTALAYARNPHDPPLDPSPILFGVSLAVLTVIALATLYRMVSLDGGGAKVAQELGATLVSPDTQNPAHRRLRNVVEEIAIASGVPVPQLFVLEQEAGINAFAAGYSPADAAVTVTRGALDKLSRDELQGVIAHEFSHILNGDMRLNIRLMGLLFGILVLGIIGGKVLQYGPRGDRKGGGAILIVALGLFAIGYIGVFFGRLIKAGISRQREYLADASAVQFTRQSQGIAGALKKLAGIDGGSRLGNTHGEEVAHMLFGDGIGYSALFATHPPVLARIKLLEPDFNPAQLAQARQRWNDPGYAPDEEERPLLADFAAAPASRPAVSPPLPGAGAVVTLAPAALTARVGQPQAQHYDCAAMLHQALPAPLLAAARDQERAVPLIFALLLDPAGEAVRGEQQQLIARDFGAAAAALAQELQPQLAALHPAQRLPLADIAMPSLRRLPRERLLQLVRTVVELTYADGQVAVFEWCLGRVLRLHISEALQPARAGAPGRRRLEQGGGEAGLLLSTVAGFGQDDETSARRAYASGMQKLPLRQAPAYRAVDPVGWPAALDQALRILDELEPAAKAQLLEALGATIAADGKVTVEEAELLRAVCAGLHCPLPPLLAEAA
jgi:Zn-dependent protease with chaperone function